ncbi:MAG TPA: methyltransferase domain-containing protein [Bryobacteraceae bacterium]|nr:methyltransferase domain-containing protein [Bryobacteraceae bacterium]
MPSADIRSRVRDAYSAAADHPDAKHPFPVGREFAESLGYPALLLSLIPAASVEAFSGVSNISMTAEIEPGDTVLDLGCGAGLDALIASERVGITGRVVAVDFSEAMLRRAQAGTNVVFCLADGERLPLADASVDVALVNGIFNLNPVREAIFGELARVLRPGGKVHAAELILARPLSAQEQGSEANWFA